MPDQHVGVQQDHPTVLVKLHGPQLRERMTEAPTLVKALAVLYVLHALQSPTHYDKHLTPTPRYILRVQQDHVSLCLRLQGRPP